MRDGKTTRHLVAYKPSEMPMFLSFCPIFGLGYHLQVVYLKPLVKAF